MSRAARGAGRRTVLLVTTSETPDTGYLPAMLNPFEPGYFDDPYSQYRRVRERDPVHLSPIGSFGLFRYEDVQRAARSEPLRRGTAHDATGDDGRPGYRGDARRAARGRHSHHAQPRSPRPPPAAPAGVEGLHAPHDRGPATPGSAAGRPAPR